MKYYITYCITHPKYTPTTATGAVEACTRLELEGRLTRGIAQWKTRGYTVTITKIASVENLRGNPHEGII